MTNVVTRKVSPTIHCPLPVPIAVGEAVGVRVPGVAVRVGVTLPEDDPPARMYWPATQPTVPSPRRIWYQSKLSCRFGPWSTTPLVFVGSMRMMLVERPGLLRMLSESVSTLMVEPMAKLTVGAVVGVGRGAGVQSVPPGVVPMRAVAWFRNICIYVLVLVPVTSVPKPK